VSDVAIRVGEPVAHTGSATVRPESSSAAIKRVLTPPQPMIPSMGSPPREADEEGRRSPRAVSSGGGGSKPSSSALRLGIMLSFILTAHNLPEGLAVGLGTVKSAEAGLLLCAAM
jgi:zinc transporter ZupT